MIFYTIPPPPSLARYVRFFWVFEGEASATDPYIHRAMADNCVEIAFYYKGRFDGINLDNEIITTFTSGIHGQTQNFRRFIAYSPFGIFGAYIYPFAIPKLFAMPCSALSDQLPDLASVLGNEARDLEEKIITAPDNYRRTQLLSAYLEKRLLSNQCYQPVIYDSVIYIIQTKGLIPVQQLADEFYMSKRQFERRFKEFTGFSPKLFSRITRFQSTLDAYGNKRKSLTDIAHDCGYYDQSHFINDFKEFSGYQPGFYFSGQAKEGTAWKDV